MELIFVDKNNYKDAIAVQRKIFPNENGTLNILASLDREMFMEKTGIYYVDDHVKYYLAKVNNEYVGITGIYYYDLDNAWLAWFGIIDEYRNKGLGKKLLRKTLEIAASMNFKSMRLYTSFLDNQDAIKMYEKEGFIGEKYTAEKLSYDCRIYSKSLVSDTVDLWNNKDLNLGHQSELDHMNNEKINEILKIYDELLKQE
jgi:GNAT superfamily N-acetyltransferase